MAKVGVIGVTGGWSSVGLTEAFEKKTGFGCLIDMQKVVLDLQRGTARCGDIELDKLDALVIKKIGRLYSPDLLDRLAMLRFLSGWGMPVFSEPFHIKRVLDRLSCTVTLRLADLPMPATVITENIDKAVEVVNQLERVVLKPLYTSKARGMKVVEAGSNVRAAVEQFRNEGNPVLYIQKLLDLPGHDLGLAFLGGEFLGCYARKAAGNAWHTTTRSGGKYHPYQPDEQIMDLARRAEALFDLDFTCVDIAETSDGPVVFEVSAFGGFRGLLEANRIDAADLYADYVLKRINAS